MERENEKGRGLSAVFGSLCAARANFAVRLSGTMRHILCTLIIRSRIERSPKSECKEAKQYGAIVRQRVPQAPWDALWI